MYFVILDVRLQIHYTVFGFLHLKSRFSHCAPATLTPTYYLVTGHRANSVGLYTIQNYKDCKQYKIIKIVNNTKLYELFISPGNLQDGLHQVYE